VLPVRVRVLLVGISIPLALWAALPVLSNASLEDRRGDIDKTIKRKNRTIERQKGQERRLSGQIQRYDTRIGSLQVRINGLQTRQDSLQADLDVKLGELGEIQENLKTQRARLVRLRARLAEGRRILADRLVELYKADDPDVMTVILNANGFADLLERSEFIGRVGRQDQKIVTRVTTDKAEATATTKRLGKLEDRKKVVVGIIAARRNQVASVREEVTAQRDNFADARSDRQDILGGVRADRVENQEDVAALARESERITARLAGSSGTAGPVRAGSGGLIWPVNGPITSPFCERRAWEACHPGIDIGVPGGTPIRAAASGKVVLAGPNGGYGNYTCIQHAGPLQTCYAHQSSIQVSVGQSVSQGQVIGLVGCTGLCFGDHLHFETRINGSVVNPMNYLG
jgi:murein DD-endopeptidase MepM/ murein hydrolase activator NlpD